MDFLAMKEIKLSTTNRCKHHALKLVALVDDEDYDWLMQWNWYGEKNRNTFYASRNDYSTGKKVKIKMHREIMKAKEGQLVDHRFNNGLDNRKKHLRICTHSQNLQNVKPCKNKSSQYKGVSWNKRQEKWIAVIMYNNIRFLLGNFKDEIVAALAYNEAAKKYHGEFAFLNRIKIPHHFTDAGL